ncbi:MULTISPECIES: ABC transporter permease subunit [Spirulina sp. CCY15215]|uniref:ABC transporter permease subunit n=1 Tax=Spirulina sp. CCY15215 TaxID=2767591 RepID=UPI00194F879F|nr:ABC transporter permease subunit [Spirulina major]
MPVFWNLVAIELEKTVRRPLFLFFLGLLVGLLLFIFLGGLFAFELVTTPESKVFFKELLAGTAGGELALSLVLNLGSFSLLILTAAISTSEYQWRVLHLYLSHGVGRTILLSAKLTALAAIAVLFVLVALILGLVLGLPLVIPMGGEVTIAGIGKIFGQAPRVFLALLPSIAIVFPIAILTRSIAATNTITLLYVFIVEPVLSAAGNLVGEPFSQLTRYLPFQLTQALVRKLPEDIPEGMEEEFRRIFFDPSLAALGVTLWVIFFAIAAWLIFRQQDLTS